MDVLDAAPIAGPGCSCFEAVRQHTAPAGEVLLLAPLDEDADAALAGALQLGGYSFARFGPAFALPTARRELAGLSAILSLMPRPLHTRVKGVFAGGLDSPSTLLSAFLQAEPLPLFFEQAEVAWAREALRDD